MPPRLGFSFRGLVRRRATYAFLAALLVVVVLLIVEGVLSGDDDEGPETGLQTVDRGPTVPIVIPAGEPITVGVSTALTGPSGGRGQEYRDAVLVAVERWKAANGPLIGGHEIIIVSQDDGCTEGDITKQAARLLLRRPGLVGVLGPQCSAGTRFVVPSSPTAEAIYADAAVVVISGSATASMLAEEQPEGGFFFRTAYRNDYQGSLWGNYVADILGGDSAWVIDDGETYGQDLASSGEFFLREAGVQVTRAMAPQGAVDFSDVAALVAAANPDAVLFAGFNPEAGLLLRQIRDAGWQGAYGAGDAVCGADGCDFLVSLGDLAEGAAFSGCSPPLDPAFLAEFRAVHGKPPTASFVAHYADAATILLNAVAAVAEPQSDGSIRIDPQALRDAVAGATLRGGLSGDITFDAAGDRAIRDVIEGLETFAQDLGLLPCHIENGTITYFED